MGVNEDSQQVPTPTRIGDNPESWLRKREVAHTALRQYLESRGKEIPPSNKGIYQHTAKILSQEEFADLERQFRFGGKQSLNFWVITGISDKLSQLKSEIGGELPTAEEVQDQKGEPYLVNTREFGGRLYIICGSYVSQKTTDPKTGYPNRHIVPDDCVAVVNNESDLVHVRTASVPLARKICRSIARSVDISPSNSDIFYKPVFDQRFIDKLSEHIEKFVNMTVRVEEGADRTAGSIKFTSTKKDNGEYSDLREDESVQSELEGGTIKRGYVKLSENDFAFEMNRKQSKIWFRSYEREERICELGGLIDNVLRQSGGYPQRKLQGFTNVPE